MVYQRNKFVFDYSVVVIIFILIFKNSVTEFYKLILVLKELNEFGILFCWLLKVKSVDWENVDFCCSEYRCVYLCVCVCSQFDR